MSITHIHKILDLGFMLMLKSTLSKHLRKYSLYFYLMKITSKVAGMIIDIIINSIYVVKLSSNTNFVVNNCSVILWRRLRYFSRRCNAAVTLLNTFCLCVVFMYSCSCRYENWVQMYVCYKSVCKCTSDR